MTSEETRKFAQAQDGSPAAIELVAIFGASWTTSPLLADVFTRLGEDEPKSVVAADIGLDRFALDRLLNSFRRNMRLAA